MGHVVIAGAGPTGLMLACELRRAGVSVEVLDQLDKRSDASRAAGMHVRTMEVLDQRGMLDTFLAEGRPAAAGHFAGIPLDMSTLPTRYPYSLVLMQAVTERLLERFAAELGATVSWSTSVVGVDQDADGVTVTTGGPNGVVQRHADYLVGCDGGRSAVRRLAGISFQGYDASFITLLGDVELDDAPVGRVFLERRPAGMITVLPFGALTGESWQRVMVTEYQPVETAPPATLDGLRASLIRVAGTDFGIHSPRWVSRFADAARQAGRYRNGRIFLAGDAAHIHSPLGGQGMNLGIHDATNLGWKLGAVLNGHASDRLLDTYHDERHPVAARVLENTRSQTSLLEPGDNAAAMRSLMQRLLRLPAPNELLAAEISGLDVCYGHGDGLAGLRVPDVELVTAAGRRRVYELLRSARPVLLDLNPTPERSVTATDFVDYVAAHCPVRQWRLPVLGWSAIPSALLIRPDGYIAWASSDGSDEGLREAAEYIGMGAVGGPSSGSGSFPASFAFSADVRMRD
jgi:2-polyprenyl-6-methoxyphenol hydroxylase-like FAD-dependent oxidoreductase